MRILVIGGTGFIGAPSARRLRERGHAVTVFHRGEPDSDAATVRGDRRDLPAFREAFARLGPEVVVDTIAYTAREAAALAETFRGIAKRLVVLSSQDVYAAYGRLLRLEDGPPGPLPISEDAPLRASRYPYRAAARPGEMAFDYDKVLVEAAARAAGDALPMTVLRLPAVYGPGDRQRRVSALVEQMRTSSVILVDRAKASWRWTRGFVEDVADAVALAAGDERAAGRTYNAGEQDALAEADWVREVGSAACWSGEVRAVDREDLPPGAAEPYDFSHHLEADTRRIRSELGFRERVGRAEGIRRAVESIGLNY